MSIIKRMRKQKAVWWQRGSADKYGKFVFDAPVEIDCRWQDEIATFTSPTGELVNSRSTVFVDREMSVGDRLQLGSIDSTTPDDPLAVTDAYEIKRFDKLPNLKNTETLLTAYL